MPEELQPDAEARHDDGEAASRAATAAGGDAMTANGDMGAPKKERAKGLLAIGLFKLSKAVFFLLLGLAALHLVHVNLGDLTLRAAAFFHFDPEGQFASQIQDQVDLISGHQLRQVSMGSIFYACVSVVEGVGLMMEQTWAEYLTLVLTILGLPVEIFEILRNPTSVKFSVLAINLLVLGYLIWYLRRTRRLERERVA